MAGLNERPPVYLSPRSADVVLSEIRPTKLAPDALRSVNVLLDELMWMLLSTSRSFATDQIKSALGKLLPTALGKEALLEAEVELQAYWERTTDKPPRPYAGNAQDFPTHPAFELLRLKCEAYSTFNDTDEDSNAEKRWQAKVAAAPGFEAHNVHFIAPAALYLTAIIEHVCEHLLSNTGRVASRDSSRSSATLLDLYTALCEDDSIYGLFKIMKVHSQIEAQCKAAGNKLTRKKSFTRSISDTSRGPSRSDSPFNGDGPLAKPGQIRESSDASSINSGTAAATAQGAGDKSMTKKIFGRLSMDKDSAHAYASTENGEKQQHRRTPSLMSGRRSSLAADDPGSSPSEVEFDELMRSGATMKVSLTPDRLRTFEVYSKDKTRGPVTKIVIPQPTAQPTAKTPLQASSAINTAADPSGEFPKSGLPIRKEASDSEVVGHGSNAVETASLRSAKLMRSPPVAYEQQIHGRSRSTSNTTVQSQKLGRKGSLSAMAIESAHSQNLRGVSPTPTPTSTHPKSTPSMSGAVRRTKSTMNGIGRDSLDDIMGGSSDDDLVGPVKKKPPVAGRRRAPTVGGISGNTADLIDFLNSGPPDLPKTMGPSESNSSNSSVKRGRLRSIVSKFKSGSQDKLASQASFDDLMSRPKQSGVTSPAQYIPPPLSAKRSLHSLQSFSTQATSNLPKPPPPPPVNYGEDGLGKIGAPLSPPQSPSAELASSHRHRISPTTSRKAVPSLADLPESSGSITSSWPPTSTAMSISTAPSTPSRMDLKVEIAPDPIANPQENKPMITTSSLANGTQVLHYPETHALRLSPKPKSSQQQMQQQSASPPLTPDHPHAALPTASGPQLSQIMNMRRMLASATTADECRLLVDIFCAQAGLRFREEDIKAERDPASVPSKAYEEAVVDALLNGGAARGVSDRTAGKESNSDAWPASGMNGKRDVNTPTTSRSGDYHLAAYAGNILHTQVSAEA